MPTDPQPRTGQVLAFGPFQLYPEQRVLVRADAPLRLGSRAREILVALVERAGEVIKKRELIQRVWPDTIVEEGTLRVHIATLRKVLGDGQPGTRYVENVTGHGYRFVAPVRRLDTPYPALLDADQSADLDGGVPAPPTRIIGRASAIAALARDLPERRFVTIVGPGGIGKTTVAIAVAQQLRASCPDGIRFVELASVTDPQLLAGTVASALGLTTASDDPFPSIARFLEQKQMLVVLDNCEHVVESAALLAEELLTRAAGLSVIATSREALGARGEWVLRLAPLDLPPPDATPTAAEARSFSAIELFIDRATASLDTFELSDADTHIITDICRKLDGVPLAIELAAARVNLLGVHGLASRLENGLGLLAAGRRTAVARHQTLRATLDWSHELLPRTEQIALRRLAVFSGAFDLSAAIAVVADDEINAAIVADLIAALAAKSLVTVQLTGKEVLYRFLGITQAYALEKLQNSSESEWIKRRHAQLCCSWGDGDLDSEPRSLGRWTAANTQRLDDVRAALEWCQSPNGDPLLGANLTASSAPIWFQSSFVNEYRRRLESALQLVKTARTSDAALELRLNVAFGNATLYATGSTPSAISAFNEALKLAQRLGDTVHHRRALWGLWVGRMSAGDYASALGFAEAFCLLAHNSNDPGAMVAGDRMIALAHHFLGNQFAAQQHAERALTWPSRPVAPLSESHFQVEHRIAVQAEFARILWLRGFPDQAVRMGRESLESAQSSGHSLSLCYALINLCGVVLRTGDLLEAERLLAMLLDHSSRHSLGYWHFWGRCLELALARHKGDLTSGVAVLRDPLCTPVQQESLATLHEGLVSQEAIVRAENGLAGWAAAEILRVKAEHLLRRSGTSAATAEGLLRQCLEIAREQGALSWELRTATSLARLWHQRSRIHEAHDLLQSVHDRFTEGFGTVDVIRARTLLQSLSVGKRSD